MTTKAKLSDEMVLRIVYGSQIKKQAYHWQCKLRKQVNHRKINQRYLDFLLDRYGKYHYEQGLILIKQLRYGREIRALYQGFDYTRPIIKGSTSWINQHKLLLKSSVMSLNELIKKALANHESFYRLRMAMNHHRD